MGLIGRNPVVSSLALCILLGATLITAALVMPLRETVDHAAGHLSVAVPVLLLLTCVLLWWPPAGPELATRVARATFVAGLAIGGLGLVTEAIGALGYAANQDSEANDLTTFHDIGVAVWPVGFMVFLAGAIMSGGAGLAQRHGANPKLVAGSVILAVVAVAAFFVGALIFGY